MVLLDLEELNVVVERHEIHTNFASELDMRRRLGRIGKDDTIGSNAQLHHLLNLAAAGAIKVGPQSNKRLQDLGLVAALDRIEGLHTREHASPLLVLAVHIAKIDDVEGIPLRGAPFNNALTGLANRFLVCSAGRYECKVEGSLHYPKTIGVGVEGK